MPDKKASEATNRTVLDGTEQFLAFAGSTNYRVPTTAVAGFLAAIQVKTGTSYTLAQGDHNTILEFTNAAAVTVTVPPGLTLPYIVGISQGGAGQVTLAEGAGVTIDEPDGFLATQKQYVMMSLIAFASNVYRLHGRAA